MSKKNRQPNVLVVDDQPIFLIEKVLSEMPLNVIYASSGKQAIALYQEHDFFVILMDVAMPNMNGFEVVGKICKMEKTENIPIIFITAGGTKTNEVRKGYQSGAVDYIFKMFLSS